MLVGAAMRMSDVDRRGLFTIQERDQLLASALGPQSKSNGRKAMDSV